MPLLSFLTLLFFLIEFQSDLFKQKKLLSPGSHMYLENLEKIKYYPKST